MAITAAMVKELREMTGAGMMDCKKALAATEGNMEAAVDFLREKGLATAQKKASRIAAEGIVATALSEDGKKAVAVEVNAETDFVAKNEKFRTYVADVAAQALNTTAADIDAFMAEPWALDTTKTVKEALAAQIAVIGENMNIRRFKQVEEQNGFVSSYIHAEGKIGVLVDVETDVVNDEIKEMAKNIAMQITAMKPVYTNDSEVDEEYKAHELEIIKSQIENDPKHIRLAHRQLLIQRHLGKFQPRDLRYPIQHLGGALHHHTVLVKIEVCPHVGHVAHDGLLIYPDPDVARRQGFHLQGTDKRDISEPSGTALGHQKQRIGVSLSQHQLFNLRIRIPLIALHRHIPDSKCIEKYGRAQHQQSQYHGGGDPFSVFSLPFLFQRHHLFSMCAPRADSTRSGCSYPRAIYPSSRTVVVPRAKMPASSSAAPPRSS